MGNDSLDNQHLEYEQFFVMQAADEDNKDQISSDHSTKLLRVMAEHKSLLQKISKWVDDETTFCLMNLILLFNSSDIRNQKPDLNWQKVFALFRIVENYTNWQF